MLRVLCVLCVLCVCGVCCVCCVCCVSCVLCQGGNRFGYPLFFLEACLVVLSTCSQTPLPPLTLSLSQKLDDLERRVTILVRQVRGDSLEEDDGTTKYADVLRELWQTRVLLTALCFSPDFFFFGLCAFAACLLCSPLLLFSNALFFCMHLCMTARTRTAVD